MMGCQPHGSTPHPDTRYTLANSQTRQTVSKAHQDTCTAKAPLTAPGQNSPLSSYQQDSGIVSETPMTQLSQQGTYRSEVTSDYYPPQSEQSRYHQYRDPAAHHHQQRFAQQQSRGTEGSQHQPQFGWPVTKTTAASQQYYPPHTVTSTVQAPQTFGHSITTVVTHYQPESHLLRPVDTATQLSPTSPQHFKQRIETVTALSQPVEVAYLQPPPATFTQPLPDPSLHHSDRAASPYPHFGESSEGLRSPQPRRPPQQTQPHPGRASSPLHSQQQQYYQHSPTSSRTTTMLDKKPTLQVVTTDHSPVSPSSSTSSPRFIFPPDMQSSTSSGHSGSSPFMSPIKREVKWEVGTPPQASEVEGHQVYRERVRMLSGDTEVSETLVDSETGSSLLEDSSSSREQSPFSAMAESLSLRSPSELSPSPLTRKVFQRQPVTVVSEDEGEEWEGGVSASTSAGGPGEGESHPPKFKKRLHERYVLSLQDVPYVKQEVVDMKNEGPEGGEVQSEGKRPVSKLECLDSPTHSESPMPKSPRRSSSDTDMVRTESTEMGASSCDEGDVFMEPTGRARAKHKPPKLHQREPLDLSRGQYPSFRSSSGSSPIIDPDHISPASKMYSPVFRSPHRLNYSPHALLSPQSQSPLCSVPEGGRIFNFNVPSPLEGAHSDSDLISPSPMSPRIFTFPPQGGVLNPMSEVNRLAVSPRAPYTPPPSMRGKMSSGGWQMEGAEGMYGGKRSLSESDMTYLCPVCGQVFPTNDNLAKHMAKHLPTETVRVGDSANKVHYCKVCNRSFSRSDMLTRHMRLHTGLKPYECLDCGQVFSRSDHLNTHRRTHTGEKPYRCPHCPYAACRRDMITRHMRTHAKRSSRRARYLSVPDNDGAGGGGGGHGDPHKPSGSISSTETTDSQEYSTTAHTCSVSSVDSVDCEAILASARPQAYVPVASSMDSLLSVADHDPRSSPSPSSRKPSDELESEEGMARYEQSQYDRFMRYRKARNWSTTSLESVDSEEAQYLREALVDDAFHDIGSSQQGMGGGGQGAAASKDPSVLGLDSKTLLKCFISSQHPEQHSGSSGSS